MSKKSDNLFKQYDEHYENTTWAPIYQSRKLIFNYTKGVLDLPSYYGQTQHDRLALASFSKTYTIINKPFLVDDIQSTMNTTGYDAPDVNNEATLLAFMPGTVKKDALEIARNFLMENERWFDQALKFVNRELDNNEIERYGGEIITQPHEPIHSSNHIAFDTIKENYPTKEEQQRLELNNYLLGVIDNARINNYITRGNSTIIKIEYSNQSNNDVFRIEELDGRRQPIISYMIYDPSNKNNKKKLSLIRQKSNREGTTLSYAFVKQDVYRELFTTFSSLEHIYTFLDQIMEQSHPVEKSYGTILSEIVNYRKTYIKNFKENQQRKREEKSHARKETFEELISSFDPKSNKNHYLIPYNVDITNNMQRDSEEIKYDTAIIVHNKETVIRYWLPTGTNDTSDVETYEMIKHDYNARESKVTDYKRNGQVRNRNFHSVEYTTEWPNSLRAVNIQQESSFSDTDSIQFLPLLSNIESLKESSKYLVRDAKDFLFETMLNDEKIEGMENNMYYIHIAHVIEGHNVTDELAAYLETYVRQIPQRNVISRYDDRFPAYMEWSDFYGLKDLEPTLLNILLEIIHIYGKQNDNKITVAMVEEALTKIGYTKGLNKPFKLKNNLLRTFQLYPNIETILYEEVTNSLKFPNHEITGEINIRDYALKIIEQDNEKVKPLAIWSTLSQQTFDKNSLFYNIHRSDRQSHEKIEDRTTWLRFFDMIEQQFNVRGFIDVDRIYKHALYLRDQEAFYGYAWGDQLNHKIDDALLEWGDYLTMAVAVGKDLSDNSKFYVKNLASQHKIIQTLYEVTESKKQQEKFRHASKKYEHLNRTYDEYTIEVAKEAGDLADEGNQLSHCVSSYVDRMIKETSIIFFLRKAKEPNKSLITIEITADNQSKDVFNVQQERGKNNRSTTKEEHDIIEQWRNQQLT